MDFAPAWRPLVAAKCSPTAAPRAASGCRRNTVAPNQAPDPPREPAPARPGRLKRRAEFLRVAARGRKAPTAGLVLQALARPDNAPVRLGFTVTKKVGNAVIRNRTRRRLREAARLLLRDHPAAGADLVLVGRDTTRARPFPLLIEDLAKSLAKLGVRVRS